jgi:hypothetical protein
MKVTFCVRGVSGEPCGMPRRLASHSVAMPCSRRDLLHLAANASRGRENVVHAPHRGISRERCGVFYAKAVRRLMAPAGIDGGDEAVHNGAAQDDLFAALLYQHPLAC